MPLPVPLRWFAVFLEAHVEQLFAGILERFLASAAPRAEKIVSQSGMRIAALFSGGQVATPGDSDESCVIPVQHRHTVRFPLHDVAG